MGKSRGLYHKTYEVVIYGFRNKLECLFLNARLGLTRLPGTNTLACYGNCNYGRNKFYEIDPRSLP
jgi:hypothetical protein